MSRSDAFVDRGDGILVPVEQMRRELDEQGEAAMIDALHKMHEEPVELKFRWTSWEAYLTFSALQLTVTHPELGEQLQVQCEELGRRVQKELATAYPEIATLLEAGWHREFDIEGPPDGS